jgi:hypothetical protein
MSSIDFITIPHSEGGRKSLVYSYTNPIPFFFFVVLVFELRASILPKQALYL